MSRLRAEVTYRELLKVRVRAEQDDMTVEQFVRMLVLNAIAPYSAECVEVGEDRERLVVVVDRLTFDRLHAKALLNQFDLHTFAEHVLARALDDMDRHGASVSRRSAPVRTRVRKGYGRRKAAA